MSSEHVVERDRSKYSAKTHLLAQAMADVYYNGDVDAVWENFFAHAEEDIAVFDRKASKPLTEARHG